MIENAEPSREPSPVSVGAHAARLLETTLAIAGELDLKALTTRLKPAFEALPGIVVCGLAIHDEQRETLRRYTLDLRDSRGGVTVDETRREDSELAWFDSKPSQPISHPLPVGISPDTLPVALRPLLPPDVRRYVATALTLDGTVIGLLFAGFDEERKPPAERLDYLGKLARVITPVVWNCLTRQRFERGDRRRDVLITLTAAINASLEFDAVLNAARAAVNSLADQAGCSIDLLEPDGTHYRSYRAGGPLHPAAAAREDPLLLQTDDSPLAWVREHQSNYESEDLKRTQPEPTQPPAFGIDEAWRAAGIRRYVMVPMIAHGTVIGGLFMGSTEPYPALRIDVWLYENIALQVGLALESARQMRQLRERSENLTRQNVYLREVIRVEHDPGEMIGDSSAMRRVHEAVVRVAGIDSTVLITGRTGVGKELVAHAIHNAGPRAEHPLVKVNCAAIPETMVESELFGHERGAFTSAVAQRIGRFELARDGTLFLDEIGELSLAVQAKLLRVLQDGEFERVGGSKTIKSNARIIAATNRELLQSVEAGTFRGDLFYRLNVFPIHVPSLDERREDIPLLVSAFVSHFSRRMGKHFESIEPASVECLIRRPWPGNIRELRHVVERAMILCDGRVLRIECGQHAPAPVTAVPPPPPIDPMQTLAAMEAEHIRRTLAACDHVIEGPRGAAAVLGLKPSTLRSRMKRLAIRRGRHTHE